MRHRTPLSGPVDRVPGMTDHPHEHHPVVRITVARCTNDAPDELMVDIAVGPPLDGWTPEQITTALAEAVEARLTAHLDEVWRRWAAMRN